MARRKLKKRIVKKTMSDAERKHARGLRKKLAKEMPEIRAKGRAFRSTHEASVAMQETMLQLKTVRQQMGLSLADIRDRTGIERSTLSRLENDREANPTINTLLRYAAAVGRKLTVSIEDEE